MGKILALVCFLILLPACTTEPAVNENMANANRMEDKMAATPSESEMFAKEQETWDTLQKKDYNAFEGKLANDFIEVEDTGVYDKPGIVALVKDFDFSGVSISNRKMLPIDNEAVLLTYDVNVKSTYKGEATPEGPYRAASAWVKRDGQWKAIYYQMTLAEPAKPMTTGTPEKTATPPATTTTPAKTATPSGSPAETGPDPTANERIVWDLFRARNYDAFAALLAADFIEQTTDGVYDKAGTVKGVQGFDASQVDLGDWKPVKINQNAALVTYLLTPKDKKMDQERHTTIWVNRDGKWLALFHQGTPVAKPAPAAKS